MNDEVHAQLSRVKAALISAWPFTYPVKPEVRKRIHGWLAFTTWQMAGGSLRQVTGDEAPVIDADQALESAVLKREAECFVFEDGQWFVLARVPSRVRFVLQAPEKVISTRSPLLAWATELDGNFAAGAFPLDQMPRVRDLRIKSGFAVGRNASVPRSGASMAIEGVLLARILPLFLEKPDGRVD